MKILPRELAIIRRKFPASRIWILDYGVSSSLLYRGPANETVQAARSLLLTLLSGREPLKVGEIPPSPL